MTTQVEPFDLFELMTGVYDMVKATSKSKSLRVSIHITPGTPLKLVGSVNTLRHILINLASNAVKFTEAGYVSIAVHGYLSGDGTVSLRFEVADSGIGIPKDSIAHVFDNFTRAPNSDIVGGTGLGLSISKGLAELLGAKIGVASTEGAGATFWLNVDMPVAPATVSTIDASNAKIFIFGNDGAFVEPLADRLTQRGMAPTSAGDARTLIPLLREAKKSQTPRVIFIHEPSLASDVEVLAKALAALDDDDRQRLILIPREQRNGIPPIARRTQFVTSLPPDYDDAQISVALLFAGLLPAEKIHARRQMAVFPVSNVALNVLVADDNHTNQRVIAKILQRGGHHSTLADNGEQALDSLLRETFDLVIMDVNMPMLNGIEATKIFRVMEAGRGRLPIVALTADATEETAAKCLNAGMDGVITKPIEPAALLTIINNLAVTTDPEGHPKRTAEISNVSTHPRFRFRPSTAPVLNTDFIAGLRVVENDEFFDGVVLSFEEEARKHLKSSEALINQGDVQMFREVVHGLANCASNVGALRLQLLCSEWRPRNESDLRNHGPQFVGRLKGALETALIRISEYRAEPPDDFGQTNHDQAR